MKKSDYLKAFGSWLRAGWVDDPESHVLRFAPSEESTSRVKIPATFRNRKVVHESGHAIVAWLCTHTIVTELDVESTYGNGKVAYAIHHDPMRISECSWARVVIGLGGIAGELKMLGGFRSGHASRDLALAREDAALVKDIPSVPGEHAALFDKKIFAVPLDDRERRLFNAAFTLAKRLLVEHETLYLKLVERCMTQDRLSKEEIEETLGSREPVLFLRNLDLITFWSKR